MQQKVLRYLPHWHKFLILKARQMGISTLFLLWHLDATLFTPNTSTAIIAHRRDSLKYLFRIIRLAYRSCPEQIQLADGRIWRKPQASFDNANELYFKDLESTIYVALEVRSDTVHRCHVSEAHHIKDADAVLAATMGALVPGGPLTMETTANGVGGVFYDLWNEAVEGSDFLNLFYGYQHHEDYRAQVPKDFILTDEEEHYLSADGMTLEALAWRRAKMREPGMRQLFKQEFPATANEAFLTSGRSPFDREKIMDWPIRKPIETAMEGRLEYWVKPIKDRRYLVAVDCASGEGTENKGGEKEGGTDYSVIGVWDCVTLQKVAMFRAKWPYSKLHHIVYKLGKEYNTAYIAIESFPSGHGMTVINNLVENVHIDDDPYPQWMIHTTETVDKKTKAIQQKWGWETTSKSKPLIIDHLAGLIDDEVIKIYSETAQREFLRFIINEKGQYQALDGFKDDVVMESAIALYLIPNALRAGRRTATKEELGLQGM